MTTQANANDFDTAKDIFDRLKDLPKETQQRVLRWVAESLGMSSGSQSPQMTSSSKPAIEPGAASTDIKAFIATKVPRSDNQFAAAVAYFYRFEAPIAERRDSIDGAALQEAARLAGRRRLTNPRATLNNAKAAGYLDGAAPGEFTINSVGENLVAMTLPSTGEAPKRESGKPKSKKNASKTKKG